MTSSLACDQMVPWKLDLFISLLILTRDILGIIMEQYLLRKQIKIHKYTRGSLTLPQALMILEFASVWVPPANFPTDPLVFRISVSVISLTENRIQRKSAASSMNRQSVNPLNERKSSVRGTIKGGNETWWLIGKSKAVPSYANLTGWETVDSNPSAPHCSNTRLERQSEIHGQIDVKSYTDLLPLHNCFQLYIPTGFCHTEFISLNNYQWHTQSYISMFTDFKHYHVCTLSDSNNCFNLRWNDMAILNQNKHCPFLFVLWYWALSTHRTSLALSKCSPTERSLPHFPFFLFFSIFKFKFKKFEVLSMNTPFT